MRPDDARGTAAGPTACVSRLSIVASLLSLGLLAASVGTDRWTYTSETLAVTASSALSNWTRGASAITTTGGGVCGVVRFRAGLWRACPNLTAKNSSTSLAAFALSKYARSAAGYPRSAICISIPFLHAEMTQPVWKEAAFAGALFGTHRMRLSVPFFVISLILVSFAVLTSVLGHVLQNVNMLLAAVTSVFAGLSLGGGLVIYVTVASEEFEFAVRQRSPPRWHEEDNLWHRYGASFYGACLSLLLQQLSALLAMSSYLRRLKPSGQTTSAVPGSGDGRIGERSQRRFGTAKSQCSVPMSERTVKSPLKQDAGPEPFKTVAL